MRDAAGEIDRAVNRVHDPAISGVRFAPDSFFAENSNIREGRMEGPFDEFLGAHIELELDVVAGDEVGAFDGVEVAPHESTRCPGGLNGGV